MMLAAERSFPPWRLCTPTPTRGAPQLGMCDALTNGGCRWHWQNDWMKCHSWGGILVLIRAECDWQWKMDCKCVRRTDFTASAKQPNWSSRQFPSKMPGWSHRCCFSFCWGQFQLHRGTFSTHPSCLGAIICAGIFFFRVLNGRWVWVYVKNDALKRVFIYLFLGLRLIKC